ncbi:MAG: hypothetical protein ACREID_07760, partial [Planctomycetota bacterium]
MRPALSLFAFAALAAAQGALGFETEPVACKALEMKIAKPQGWQVFETESHFAAQGGGMGFRVSREPFLHDPKLFAAAWHEQIAAAGKEGKVGDAKAGRYAAFTTSYLADAAGSHRLEIWRVHVPEVEMLYNFAFSVPAGADPRPLVDGVVRSFGCVAARPRLEFREKPEALGTRVLLKL